MNNYPPGAAPGIPKDTNAFIAECIQKRKAYAAAGVSHKDQPKNITTGPTDDPEGNS